MSKNTLYQWTGMFNSTMYQPLFVYGTIETELLDDFKDITATARLTYNGLYKLGQTVTVVLTGSNNSFSGYIGPQKVTFNFTRSDKDHIVGTYVTTEPLDSGTFNMHKVGSVT